jgi:hypothetical protein
MTGTQRSFAGFGVAGNFAGHLEQAGEIRDFAGLKTSGEGPKGIFPFHLPIPGSFLATNPISASLLALPDGAQVQGEPEVALFADLSWDDGGRVRIRPTAFAAFDDASIRREGAAKISQKKNWGPGSKGLSEDRVTLREGLVPGCPLDRFRIASFLGRDGSWEAYGQDSPVRGYSLYGPALVEWMERKLSEQADEGPLEDLPALLSAAGRPDRAVITIGATRYTPLGEATFLREGDRFAVAVYDPALVPASELPGLCECPAHREGLSLLVREVRRI